MTLNERTVLHVLYVCRHEPPTAQMRKHKGARAYPTHDNVIPDTLAHHTTFDQVALEADPTDPVNRETVVEPLPEPLKIHHRPFVTV